MDIPAAAGYKPLSEDDMPDFLVTYHGGRKPETPKEKEEGMAEWQAWAAGLDSAFTNPGNPVGITKVLTNEGVSDSGSPHPVMGFSILSADSMDHALDLMKDCPHFRFGGTIEVSEMMDMP